MTKKVLDATYTHGTLILSENLGEENEGKTLKILILDEQDTEIQKEHFFQFVDQHQFLLPDDYQFNREDIYDQASH